jgi:hypothetical protein
MKSKLLAEAALFGFLAAPAMAQNVSGTFSATLSGFQPTPSYSQLSVSSASNSVALPNGNTVVVYNIGSSDAYVTLGGSGVAATLADDVVKAGGWMAFGVGSNGYLAAITASGSTSLNISGGSGLASGSAGSASSGGGGTVAQGSAGSAGSAWYMQPGTGAVFPVSAANLPLPGGAATSALQSSIVAALGAPFQAGGSIANTSFGISGTLPAFASTPTVNVGTMPSVAIASLPALPAGSATIGAISNTTFAATQNGTWSVTANAGTNLNTSSLALETGGNLAQIRTNTTVTNPGASASAALPVQGVTGGVAMPVSISSGSIGNTSFGSLVTQWGGSSLGSATAWGTAPSGNVNGVNADVLSEPGTGSTGSSVPPTAHFAGAESSGNLVGIVQADNSVAINISTATTTQIVALSSGKKIYVVAWDVVAGGTGAITLEYGTGSNCGAGTTMLTGAYPLTAQNGIAKGGGLGAVLVVPAGNALCALTSAAVQMSGSVAYTQF